LSFADFAANRKRREGYDLELTQYDERGWRATSYTTGMEHSATSATASTFEDTPWRAVQRAAQDALVEPDHEPIDSSGIGSWRNGPSAT
jgi:hypothetical protein